MVYCGGIAGGGDEFAAIVKVIIAKFRIQDK